MSNETHTSNGKFAPGNKLGKGNPHAKKVNDLRTALMNAVSDEDIQNVVQTLVKLAKGGDVQAAKEVLDRTIGKAQANDTLTIESGSEANPFIERFRGDAALAADASALLRRMAIDAGGNGVAPESDGTQALDLGGSSGTAQSRTGDRSD